MLETLLGTALLASASSAVPAESTVLTLEPDAIVVTGVRHGSTVGIVDYDKVWRSCAECKRALAKLTLLSQPYHLKKAEISRDRQAYEESVASHALDERQAKRFLDRLPDLQRQDTTELQGIRHDMSKLIASFLRQLEPHARAAANEERTARKLGAVFDKNGKRPPAKVRKVDVTAGVIRRLDARTFAIELPEPL